MRALLRTLALVMLLVASPLVVVVLLVAGARLVDVPAVMRQLGRDACGRGLR